jgi:hypothetical protein
MVPARTKSELIVNLKAAKAHGQTDANGPIPTLATSIDWFIRVD